MRLNVSKTKNAASFYVVKTIYENKKERTIIVEKLGTEKSLREKLNGEDPYKWANAYIDELNRQEKENNLKITVEYSSNKKNIKDEQRLFNGGYLFLQKIYHELKIDMICKTISSKYKFSFDLDSVLSRLLYGRIIFPGSKLATYQLASKFIEQTNFELQHIYRSLEVIAKENDFIQSELYRNSLAISKRNTGILYYDCTNFFFEIEQEEGLKQYGISKENRPNPIVQMGLFLDGDGIPLAFDINSGNTNEQITLKPLEKKILSDFNLSKFIVCTDAGLASAANRKFNNINGRAFITTQSIKKLKGFLKEWSLDSKGWRLPNSDKTYDIAIIDEEACKNLTFYKERWIKEDDLEQRLIVTYSVKYRNYQTKIRQKQIERAQKLIDSNPKKLNKPKQNDFKRFILKTSITTDGEIADKEIYKINNELISEEKVFDGFYAVCTNLEDNISDIIKINHGRWEIEESFRIMKSEFKARPVYLKRDDRIKAHFTTCFISLMIFRLLEKKLEDKFTCCEIVEGLRNMDFLNVQGKGYLPTYTRTDFTDALHEAFGFRTDYEIVTKDFMKKILKDTKK